MSLEFRSEHEGKTFKGHITNFPSYKLYDPSQLHKKNKRNKNDIDRRLG